MLAAEDGLDKQWQTLAEKELHGKPLSDLTNHTPEGLTIKPIYTARDLPNGSKEGQFPGVPPYTRGPRATMYTGRPWTIRQYAGFSTAEESNSFYRTCLKKGQKGLSVAFDLPTHRGYDSDNPRVTADVGKAGVAIDSVEDMKLLFEGIPLDKMSVSMTMNGAVLPILASYIVAAEEQGVPKKLLSGTIQNDILKEYIVRNTYIYPPAPSMRIVADIIEYLSTEMPKYNSISISGYHFQEAGAGPALELALTLANGQEYVNTALSRKLDIDDFAPRLSFFFGIGMDFFSEIAKLRAARTLWSEMIDQYHPKKPKSKMLRTHCQTSGYSLTEQQPYNNIVRTTIEAMAAALGGTQSLHTNSFDEAIALPTDFSARVARNTQLILQNETKLTSVVDPLGGSYYIENLTHQLIKQAKAIMTTIAESGGVIASVNSGLLKQMIEEAAAIKQAAIDSGLETIVGVNAFNEDDDAEVPVRTIDNKEVCASQVQRLRDLRSKRNTDDVHRSLNQLKAAAQSGTKNLLELAVEAMQNRATVGEVSQTLREVFGEHQPSAVSFTNIYKSHYAMDEKYLAAHEQIKAFADTEGRQPRILIAKLGQDGHDRGARVIATGFADLGFDVDVGPLFQTPYEAAKQAVENDVHAIGISSQAGAHCGYVPDLRKHLLSLGAHDIVIVVGGIIPPADHAFLLENGASCIIGPGTSIPEAAMATIAALRAQQQPATETSQQ